MDDEAALLAELLAISQNSSKFYDEIEPGNPDSDNFKSPDHRTKDELSIAEKVQEPEDYGLLEKHLHVSGEVGMASPLSQKGEISSCSPNACEGIPRRSKENLDPATTHPAVEGPARTTAQPVLENFKDTIDQEIHGVDQPNPSRKEISGRSTPPWKKGKRRLRPKVAQLSGDVVVTEENNFPGANTSPEANSDLAVEEEEVVSNDRQEFSSRSSKSNSEEKPLPPWKKKGRAKKPPPPPTGAEDVLNDYDNSLADDNGGGGFMKDSSSSAFMGKNGGEAFDADLHAELMKISAGGKKRMENTFSPEADSDLVVEEEEVVSNDRQEFSSRSSKSNSEEKPLPPWKKKGRAKKPPPPPTEEEDLGGNSVVDDNGGGGFMKDSSSSAFMGKNGGEAFDADLHAELMKTSASNKNSLRGHNPGSVHEESGSPSRVTSQRKNFSQTPEPSSLSGSVCSPQALPNNATAPMAVENDITLEEVHSFASSKDWKMRKQAFNFLSEHIKKSAVDGTFENDIPSLNLDDAIRVWVKDSNPGALDAALDFASNYADFCPNAGLSEYSARIVSVLISGPALASARRGTMRKCSDLVIKLMEVGSQGHDSVHSIVSVLLEEGMKSKKPRVLVSSCSHVLEAGRAFGAAKLPFATIVASSSKIISHSNSSVRETGMELIAELCRAVGSKSPLQSVIDCMKPSQITQLDVLLDKQPVPNPPTLTLKSEKNSPCGASREDALASFEKSLEESEAKRLANRPAVDLFEKLSKTDFKAKMKLQKWSEITAGLKLLIECGGEKPFKIKESSDKGDYRELVTQLRNLFSHTHFAVVSGAMEALAMLAEGIRENMFSHLRPVLPLLLQKTKDKKLTAASGRCLDSFYGNVMSIDIVLEDVSDSTNWKKQKNVLIRTSSLEYLARCIERGKEAGKRGGVNPSAAKAAAKVASNSLSDTDTIPRAAAFEVLKKLVTTPDESLISCVVEVVEELKSNQRIYKVLQSLMNSEGSQKVNEKNEKEVPNNNLNKTCSSADNSDGAIKKKLGDKKVKSRTCVSSEKTHPKIKDEDKEICEVLPTLDEALDIISKLSITDWDAPEDENGVLAGLRSSAWKSRMTACSNIVLYLQNGISSENVDAFPFSSLFVTVKEHTKSFKESNFNIVKTILSFFDSVAVIHKHQGIQLDLFFCKAAATLAVEKIADKKFIDKAPLLLSSLCIVRHPKQILSICIKCVQSIKSPLPHEAFLKWCYNFCVDFGAHYLTEIMDSIVSWVTTELNSSNPKLRTASINLCGEIHKQVGARFKALLLTSKNASDSTKQQLETEFTKSPFDQGSLHAKREKTCLVLNMKECSSETGNGSIEIDVPRIDLTTVLNKDYLSDLGKVEGKNSWKVRKQAMDDINGAIDKCGSLILSTGQHLAQLVEIVRALNERMNDSQSNLKPVAATVVGKLISSVDEVAQIKLGRILYSTLLTAALSDRKQQMKDSALEALAQTLTKSEIDGGGPNLLAHEGLILPIAVAIKKSEYKATGTPGLLKFVTQQIKYFPRSDSITSSKLKSSLLEFTVQVVGCLTSSKSETRSAAETLLTEGSNTGLFQGSALDKGISVLLPAQQRSVQNIIANVKGALPTEGQKSSADVQERGRRSKEPNTPQKENPSKLRGNSRSQRDLRSKKMDNMKMQPSRKNLEKDDSDSISTLDSSQPLHLVPDSYVPKKPFRINGSRDNWPSFPDEPDDDAFSTLKKNWSPLIPQSSVAVLFNISSKKTQEDCQLGCKLLRNAIHYSSNNSEDLSCIDQLDLILKWIVLFFCMREHTSGLQALLTLCEELLAFLGSRGYNFLKNEAENFLPHLVEKGAAAKGRFRENFSSLIRSAAHMYSAQKYGPLMMQMVDSSRTKKGRILALNECQRCVDASGLQGIGKKGLEILSRCIDDPLVDIRTASLDVLDKVLEYMNGDTKRLFRACNKHLSAKGQDLVKERASKRSKATRDDIREIPKPMTSPKSLASPHRLASSKGAPKNDNSAEGQYLDLHVSGSKSRVPYNPKAHHNISNAGSGADLPKVLFSFKPVIQVAEDGPEKELNSKKLSDIQLPIKYSSTVPSGNNIHVPGTGAAASLRARLAALKEKKRLRTEHSVESNDFLMEDDYTYEHITASLNNLIKQDIVYESEEVFVCGREGLKRLHAGLSPEIEDSGEIFFKAKNDLARLVSLLASTLSFGFRCCPPSDHREQEGSMSVSLLSVTLATLCVVVRDSILSKMIPMGPLEELILKTCRGLLDRRLSPSTITTDGTDTNKQLIRAVNKLALETIASAERKSCLMVLMNLQCNYCMLSLKNQKAIRLNGKLFARVLKLEETESLPYFGKIDVGAVLRAIENHLSVCKRKKLEVKDFDHNACYSFAVALCNSMIRGRYQQITSTLSQEGIDINDSLIGELILKSSEEHQSNLKVKTTMHTHVEDSNESRGSVSVGGSSLKPSSSERANCGFSAYVAAVGSATGKEEKEMALKKLQEFVRETSIDVRNELKALNLSGPFSEFILSQFVPPTKPVEESWKTSRPKQQPMSERIAFLRAKLNATQEAVDSIVTNNDKNTTANIHLPANSSTINIDTEAKPVPNFKTTAASQPPIKYSIHVPGTGSAASLRARLASLKEKK